jgi:hypothetical protein
MIILLTVYLGKVLSEKNGNAEEILGYKLELFQVN